MAINFTVVVTGYRGDFHLLPHCVNALIRQSMQGFETIIVLKDEHMRKIPRCIAALTRKGVLFTNETDTFGNNERHLGMLEASGDYVAWVNADNLVYPDWIANHAKCFEQHGSNAISVVNCHYWGKDGYAGILPRSLQFAEMDLINFALPIGVAREIDAFGVVGGGDDMGSDSHVFDAACAYATPRWDKNQQPCCAHF